MGRWEPDARGRMIRAAVELFAERGFEQTTASDIAERAGVTERTFFRHFADKREVLFDGSGTMARTAYDAILAAPANLSPLDAALAGMTAAGGILEDRRDHAVRRSRIVAANPSLQERELLKLAAMVDTTAEALHEREVDEPTASLAAHSAVTVFHVAYPIVVEYRDRFARFGAEYVEAVLAAQGRRLLVVDSAEVDDDFVRDVTEILASLCARLYGRRAATNRARRAVEAATGGEVS